MWGITHIISGATCLHADTKSFVESKQIPNRNSKHQINLIFHGDWGSNDKTSIRFRISIQNIHVCPKDSCHSFNFPTTDFRNANDSICLSGNKAFLSFPIQKLSLVENSLNS